MSPDSPGEGVLQERVVYLKEVRENHRLGEDASVGETFVDLDPNTLGIQFICPNAKWIVGPAIGGGEEVTIVNVVGNRVNFTPALVQAHPKANNFFYRAIVGISTKPVVVTNIRDELIETVAHEILHLDTVADLEDLSTQAQDNIMFRSAGLTDTLLRKRKVEHAFTSGPCGTGTRGSDEQWDKVLRFP